MTTSFQKEVGRTIVVSNDNRRLLTENNARQKAVEQHLENETKTVNLVDFPGG